jgi:hypothetical protein
MGGADVSTTVEHYNRKHQHSTLLYTLIAAKPVTVGALVDYANGMPPEWVQASAAAIAESVIEDYRKGRRTTSRRRRLIILGALLARLAFEIERIPKDRHTII